jgi:hypothetical protein
MEQINYEAPSNKDKVLETPKSIDLNLQEFQDGLALLNGDTNEVIAGKTPDEINTIFDSYDKIFSSMLK